MLLLRAGPVIAAAGLVLLGSGCIRLAAPCDAVGEGYLDADGDGFGSGEPVTACAEDIVDNADDCDDGAAEVYPGAAEVWYDGVLQDCAGKDDDRDGDGAPLATDCDDDDPAVSPDATEVWYDGVDQDCDGAGDYDQDGDGEDSDHHGGADCVDTDPAISPSADEIWYDGVDQDCDEADDYDADGDGHDALGWGDDCDDTAPDAYPGAEELCDGLDNDCDEVTDEGFDADGDGFVACVDDCDDADSTIHPDATEACDGVDEDCDGAIDEDFDLDSDGWATCGGDCDDADPDANPGAADAWYDGVDSNCDHADDYDQDADGYPGDGYGGTDCDDTIASTHPGASDSWYDGVDSDCDLADDYDQDHDGYESDAYGGTDCDDTVAATHPGATDTWYDGIDSNCDGASDFDRDADGYDSDGHGGTDCNDTAASTHPGATDAWYDGVDSNCDGASDYDQDGDGFDSADYSGDDCDDTDAGYSPDAPDVLDGQDQDCDGIDDDAIASEVAWAVIQGDTSSQHVGSGGVAFADDLDADGEDDLVISSPDDGTNSGAVWLFGTSEIAPVTPVSDAWLTLEGGIGDEVGAAFVAGLDWGADGTDDVAVGAPGGAAVYLVEPDGASDAVYAASTLAYATLTGAVSSDFGAAVASGDLDGDGVDDLVVGAPGSSKGTVYVFLGASGAASTTYASADDSIIGATAGDGIGGVLGGGGDTDADGYDDVCIGVPAADPSSLTNAGTVYLFRGASLYLNLGLSVGTVAGWTMTGSAASQAVGTSCTIANVASSTNADILAGAPGYSGGGYSGAVGVFYGASSGSESFTAADRLVRGGGDVMDGGTDLSGDGAADLLVGSPDSAWIVPLTTTGVLDLPGDAQGYWTQSGDDFGAALEGSARDLDSDGVADVAVAATAGAGSVYLLRVYP